VTGGYMARSVLSHLALTVWDLDKAEEFYGPLLELLGFEPAGHLAPDESRDDGYFGVHAA
jgi:extradiol dioxygenase family protein